ncbi:transposase, partial [Enterobacter cloacae]
RNRSHWSTSKTPSYTKSVSWQHHPALPLIAVLL